MNQTQAYRERFPGVEIIPTTYYGELTRRQSRAFSAYQSESKVVECIKDAIKDMDGWKCDCVVVKTGEHWWDAHRHYGRDAIVSTLFDQSLKGYVTKFDIERKEKCLFTLWLKVHSLSKGVETNIGPDLVEYIMSRFV